MVDIPPIMQPQFSAFTQKLMGAANPAFFCFTFSFLQILNIGLLTCTKDLNNITWKII